MVGRLMVEHFLLLSGSAHCRCLMLLLLLLFLHSYYCLLVLILNLGLALVGGQLPLKSTSVCLLQEGSRVTVKGASKTLALLLHLLESRLLLLLGLLLLSLLGLD